MKDEKFRKLLGELIEDEGCEAADAIEWLEYNTMRAIGYGDTGHNPIIVTLSREAIEERMFILDYPDTSEKKQGKEGE